MLKVLEYLLIPVNEELEPDDVVSNFDGEPSEALLRYLWAHYPHTTSSLLILELHCL